MSGRRVKKAAVLLSGSGTTLENLFEKVQEGRLPIEIAVVVSSRSDAYGLERARKRGVPAYVFRRRDYGGPDEYAEAVFRPVRESGAEIVALAGFMVMIGIPSDYRNRVMNIHPALLPSFGGKGMYGHHVHEAVIARGCKVSGCTAHLVDEQYDHGPIVMQKAVPVLEDDTPESLAERVQSAEREVYPEALRALAEDRLLVEGRRARIAPGPASG
jgi:phosphoribosylglycinamide formyltransferase-1